MIFSSLPPVFEERTLLLELNHRINNEFASVINLVSVAAPAGIGENSATTRAGRLRHAAFARRLPVLRRSLVPEVAGGRVIVAHLGSGAKPMKSE
jgi:acetate kinase